MTASGLEILAARLNSGDMQALQALQAFAGLVGAGAYRAPGDEQLVRPACPDHGTAGQLEPLANPTAPLRGCRWPKAQGGGAQRRAVD
jgi:hypothetical protein